MNLMEIYNYNNKKIMKMEDEFYDEIDGPVREIDGVLINSAQEVPKNTDKMKVVDQNRVAYAKFQKNVSLGQEIDSNIYAEIFEGLNLWVNEEGLKAIDNGFYGFEQFFAKHRPSDVQALKAARETAKKKWAESTIKSDNNGTIAESSDLSAANHAASDTSVINSVNNINIEENSEINIDGHDFTDEELDREYDRLTKEIIELNKDKNSSIRSYWNIEKRVFDLEEKRREREQKEIDASRRERKEIAPKDLKNVRMWYDGPKTIKIGSKYLNIDNIYKDWVEREAKSPMPPTRDSHRMFDGEMTVGEYAYKYRKRYSILDRNFINEYKIDPQRWLVEYLDIEIRLADKRFRLTAVNDENFLPILWTDEYWTSLTGDKDFFKIYRTPGSEYAKESCILILICEYIDEIEGYTTVRNIDNYKFNARERKGGGRISQYLDSARMIFCRVEYYLTRCNYFKYEKKRYDLEQAFTKFFSKYIEIDNIKELYEYFNNLPLEELQKMREEYQYWKTEPLLKRIPARFVPEYIDLSKDGPSPYEAFSKEVIDPFFTEDELKKILDYYYELDNNGLELFDKPPVEEEYYDTDKYFHRPEHDAGYCEKIKKYTVKGLKKEDPLARYEFSPEFQKRILNEGYEGVGFDTFQRALATNGIYLTREEFWKLELEQELLTSYISASSEYAKFIGDQYAETNKIVQALKGTNNNTVSKPEEKKEKKEKKGILGLFKK